MTADSITAKTAANPDVLGTRGSASPNCAMCPFDAAHGHWQRLRLDRLDRIARMASRLFNVAMAWVEDETEEQIYRFSQVGGPDQPFDPAWPATVHGLPSGLETLGAGRSASVGLPGALGRSGYRYLARTALTDEEGVRLGTLVLADRRPRQFDDGDMETLGAFTKTIAAELSMHRQSTTDPLTGLMNRLGFVRAAEAITELNRHGGFRASLLLFDLDEFKQINDRFGHAEGDRALQQFARLLTQSFRVTDLAARLGGDEFAVLANNTGRHAVSPAIERLQLAVDAHNAQSSAGYRLAFSVGVIEMTTQRPIDLRSLLERADAAMYAHKQRRR